jgi:hypothetical protein
MLDLILDTPEDASAVPAHAEVRRFILAGRQADFLPCAS